MPDRILDWLKLFIYRIFSMPVFSTYICPYYGPWAYGLHTENPGPIITNGMGPVSE